MCIDVFILVIEIGDVVGAGEDDMFDVMLVCGFVDVEDFFDVGF